MQMAVSILEIGFRAYSMTWVKRHILMAVYIKEIGFKALCMAQDK